MIDLQIINFVKLATLLKIFIITMPFLINTMSKML